MTEPLDPRAIVFRRLANGLRLVAVREPRRERVFLTALVDAGASSDPSGQKGLAHFLEHLVCGHWRDMLRLMPTKLERAFHAKELFFDAETQLDYTIYKSSFPAELLPEFAVFDSARWGGRLIEPAAMARGLPVILEELRTLAPSRPEGKLYRTLYGMVYGTHPYGAYTFGESADISRLSFEDCLHFFKSRCGADAVVLVAVSPLAPDALADVIERHYAPLARRTAAPPSLQPPTPAVTARHEKILQGGDTQARVLAAIPLPPALADVRSAAVMRGLNEYVVRRLRRRSPQWHGFLPAMRAGGLWELLGTDAERSCDRLQDDLLSELELLAKRKRASPEIMELLRALPRLLERSWEDPFKLSETLGLFELLGPGWRGALELREASATLRWSELREFLSAHVSRDRVFTAGVEGGRN